MTNRDITCYLVCIYPCKGKWTMMTRFTSKYFRGDDLRVHLAEHAWWWYSRDVMNLAENVHLSLLEDTYLTAAFIYEHNQMLMRHLARTMMLFISELKDYPSRLLFSHFIFTFFFFLRYWIDLTRFCQNTSKDHSGVFASFSPFCVNCKKNKGRLHER